MSRPWMLLVFALLLAGCRSGPQGDPFLLGRSTIPPPGTGAIGQPGVQPSLAPPAAAVTTAPPAMVPINPAPPATTAPPANNPYIPRDGSYNFRQGSTRSPSSEWTASTSPSNTSSTSATSSSSSPSSTPSSSASSKQTVATVNRAAAADTASTPITVKASPTTTAASDSTVSDKDPGKSGIVQTSFDEPADQATPSTAKTVPTATRLSAPSTSAIRIIEPGTKSDADSAATARPDATLTASSWQPQWK